jgi:hypothetical protein
MRLAHLHASIFATHASMKPVKTAEHSESGPIGWLNRFGGAAKTIFDLAVAVISFVISVRNLGILWSAILSVFLFGLLLFLLYVRLVRSRAVSEQANTSRNMRPGGGGLPWLDLLG